jgi:hypothetical protein
MSIDVGDQVRHWPTGETWVVALVEDDKLYWMGYPFGGYADLSDCSLVESADEESRNSTLALLAMSTGGGLPIIRARARVESK